MFCLPWLLTWFSHTLNDIEQVYRIFDFLLCQQPYFIIYLCASLLLNTKQWLLDHVKEEQEGGGTRLQLLFQELRVLLPSRSLYRHITHAFSQFLGRNGCAHADIQIFLGSWIWRAIAQGQKVTPLEDAAGDRSLLSKKKKKTREKDIKIENELILSNLHNGETLRNGSHLHILPEYQKRAL